MKAVIVIDMPSTCAECRASYCADVWYCYAGEYRKMLSQKEIYEKPEWCPLKEMPKRKEYYIDEVYGDMYEDSTYSDGWNACLEEIEK